MERITIAAKNLTPHIDLNPQDGLLSFTGESYPENALSFYRPVIDWIRDYFDQAAAGARTTVRISLRYMNTSSTKIFMTLFDLCQDAVGHGKPVEIEWLYRHDDELMRDMGEDLRFELRVPFRFVEVE
jgi:hypothetical protein